MPGGRLAEGVTEDGGQDDGGSSLSDAARRLLSNPKGFILTVIVGAIIGFLEAVLGVVIAAFASVRQSLADAGASVLGAFGMVGDTVLRLASYPFGVLEGVAAAAGPFAPIVVAVVWALAAVAVAMFVYVLWRVLTWI